MSFYSPKERSAFEASQTMSWDSVSTAKEKIRPLFDVFPGAEFTIAASSINSLGGSGVDIAVKGDDMDSVRSTAQQIKTLLQI
jgi:hypothetical protein